MFENFRTCDRAFFGDVTDDEKGDPAGFGDPHEPAGALTHLRNASRRRGERLGIYSLNTIDDDVFRLLKRLFRIVEAGFVEE